MEIDIALQTIRSGESLSVDQMSGLIDRMLQGKIPDAAMGECLVALHAKGESVSELVGAATAMRTHMTPVATRHTQLLDTCGTGGDGAKTFNISTAAAILAAAAGAKVAKHGNRRVTSATGSADVLSELGIKIDAPREIVSQCLDELGIGFCFAPLLHPAMKHVSAVRKSIATPTLFNFLGPLCNPASAAFQVLGVGKAGMQDKIAEALSQLPIERALVVRGADGMDEITLMAATHVIEVTPGSLQRYDWQPADFGLAEIAVDSLIVNGPVESANVIRRLFQGERGGPRDIVVANAAAGIWIAGIERDLLSATARCQSAIDTGAATQLLERLVAQTHLAPS